MGTGRGLPADSFDDRWGGVGSGQIGGQGAGELILGSPLDLPCLAAGGKVFGVGLSRTGTKSLNRALEMLGLRSVHYPLDATLLSELQAKHYRFSLLDQLDAMTDITVSPFYGELDALFPHSKFILTVRSRRAWLRSLQGHWNYADRWLAADPNPTSQLNHDLTTLLKQATYGCGPDPQPFDAALLTAAYQRHCQGVLAHFRPRPQQLLVLNICTGQGWERLCPFLGCRPVDGPFPHRL